MEHPHSEEHGVTVRNTLASICSGTVRKIGHLFHREVPMYLPANLLPSRVSFCFGALDNESQGTALVRSLSDLSRWCSELGVWSILAYDKAGMMHKS